MRRAGSSCRTPGCPGIVRDGRCSKCGPRSSDYDDRRGSASERGYDHQWRKLRLMFLRANPLCVECQRSGLVVAATEVDHIVAKSRGGGDDWENLQGLCKSCHSRKTNRENRQGDGMNQTVVTIVAGSPGSGKTTWARQQMRWGDLVVDVDALYVALSGLTWYEKPQGLLPFVIEARDAVLARLQRPSDVAGAWVITSEADPEARRRLARQVNAKSIVVLETSANECLKRIANDDRRCENLQFWTEIVHRWWNEYRPGADEKIIRSKG